MTYALISNSLQFGLNLGKRRGNLSDSDNEGDESVGDETESDEDSLAHSDEMYFLSDSEVKLYSYKFTNFLCFCKKGVIE